MGSIFMPVTSDRYSDVIATQMVKLFRPPFSCVVEQWIQTPKGLRCISWSARSVVRDGNSVESIVATGRDITTLRRDMKSVRKKDEELMLVIESGIPMYYSHAPDHSLMYVSPRIRSLLRCTTRTGKRTWTEYLTDNPINAAGLERTIRAITSGRREPPYQLELKTCDGGVIRIEVNEIPVVKNGKTVSIVGSMIDITERVQVEEGMAEAEFLIRDLKSDSGRVSPGEASLAQRRSPGLLRSLLTGRNTEEPEE